MASGCEAPGIALSVLECGYLSTVLGICILVLSTLKGAMHLEGCYAPGRVLCTWKGAKHLEGC